MQTKFLGRTLDIGTMTYCFSDGSGRLPLEMMYEVNDSCDVGGQAQGFMTLALVQQWKDRINEHL